MTLHTTPEPPADVSAQMRDLERQGGDMARLAHWAAGALLFAFSAGSLLSISHAAFVTFLARWNAGSLDIPDGISLVVNVLLVLAADIALLYAASVLRVLIAAQAPKSEQRVHQWAMIGASLLESSTYLYLAWQFDRPTGLFLWTIVIARALCAPLFAAYLSMARPLPVAPRDVAYQASLASGKGVVKDVATLAADPHAPLHRKVRIYKAAALMSAGDERRFDNIIAAVAEDAPALPQPAQQAVTPPLPQMYLPRFEATAGLPAATQEAAQTASPVESDHLDLSAEAIMERVKRDLDLTDYPPFDEPPPDDGGSPTFASKRIAQESDNVTPLRRGMGRASAAPRRDRRVVNRANARAGKRGSAEYRVRHVVASKPDADLDEVARQAKVSPSTASKWLEVIAAENRVRTHREAQ